MKRFKDYLHKNALPEVYLDMDGVVADWLKGADKVLESFGYPGWRDGSWQEFEDYQRDEIRWSLLQKQENFWQDLPVMKEGKKLWRFLKPYRPHILSSIEPRMRDRALEEKRIWLHDKLNLEYLGNVHFVEHFTKQRFALDVHGRPNILIDDYEKNCQMFEEAGGIAILHESSNKTISELKKLGFKRKK